MGHRHLDRITVRRLAGAGCFVAVTLTLAGIGAASTAAAPIQDQEVVSAPASPPRAVSVRMAPTTTTTTSTTTAPPPTTVPPTTAPAPAPTALQAPAPPPPPPPPPAPAPAPAVTEEARLQASYERTVPAAWRAVFVVRLVPVSGSTSYASGDGTIKISSSHRSGGDALLDNVIAHEFGHLIAFRYGSQEYVGAGPEGFPASGSRPEELWAKCVAGAFTGMPDNSYGMAPCSGDPLAWTVDWLAAGPPDR